MKLLKGHHKKLEGGKQGKAVIGLLKEEKLELHKKLCKNSRLTLKS